MEMFQFKFKAESDIAEISTPITLRKKEGQTIEENGNAIWDTGATSSMISASMARKLQLNPIGTIQIAGVHGVANAKVYNIDIIFQNGFTIKNIKVSEASNFGGFDLLVGMDIIKRGVFLIDGTDGKLKVLFQFPADSSI
jgi:predicted aspartyl protease